MRCMERNKTMFWYALYLSKEPMKDAYGNETGELKVVYGTPVAMTANISPASGGSQIEQFGNSIQYDRVIVTDDMSCPIDENTVLCVKHPPKYDFERNLIFDYVVKKVARSLNSISIAISKVAVS